MFFTFNYTSTLGSLYEVPPGRILFIHGCADLADDDLVLGHAWHPQTRESLNDRPDIEDIDTRLMEANDIIDDYFSATFKQSADLIAQHRGFFDALTDIEQVIVLGHSLSDVDAAYFMALLEQRSAAWRKPLGSSPAVPRTNGPKSNRCSRSWASIPARLFRLSGTKTGL